VKITTPLITLFSILALTACSQNRQANPPKVDRISLIRSMAYTHRHLLDQKLDPKVGDKSSEQVLLKSHCDLIKRWVVHKAPLPDVCQRDASLETQVCIAKFHRCVGACGTFMSDCPVCEKKAARCLERMDTGQPRLPSLVAAPQFTLSEAGMTKEGSRE